VTPAIIDINEINSKVTVSNQLEFFMPSSSGKQPAETR
jgi:hypothetical protein